MMMMVRALSCLLLATAAATAAAPTTTDATDEAPTTHSPVTLDPWPPRAGVPTRVTLAPSAAAPGTAATLTYAVNATAAVGPLPLPATVPALSAGTLLRWRVAAGADAWPRVGHAGAAVGAPATLHGLPVLDWHAPDLAASSSDAGATGTDVVVWGGRGHAVAHVAKKGTTSRGWPKPKLKFRLASYGGPFNVYGGAQPGGVASAAPFDEWGRAAHGAAVTPSVATPAVATAAPAFELDSLWWEPGENSYARQAVAWATFRALGVPAPASVHAAVRVNGRFHGLFAVVEPQDGAWLARVGLASTGATLWKPVDGALSNLRPDVPAGAWAAAWQRSAGGGDVRAVAALAADLAGRGARRGDRAAALAADGAGLAATLNYLAVAAALLTPDRCTKNYALLLGPPPPPPSSPSFRLLPADSKTALASDSGLGGAHARDYAFEVADQFASPLYCDAAHPQDVDAAARDPWSRLVAAPLVGAAGGDRGRGGGGGGGGRRGLRESGGGARRVLLSAPPPAPADEPAGCDAAPAVPPGAAGTFNHAVAAVLRCPPLRAAYLSRLASVAAALHAARPGDAAAADGLLLGLVNATTARVAAAAAADHAAWRGGDPARGRAQLLTEQIPRRAAALRDRYSTIAGTVARLVPPVGGGDSVGVANAGGAVLLTARGAPVDRAVDVSGWVIDGPLAATLPPGAVIPPGGAVVVARDAAAAAAAAARAGVLGVAFGGARDGDGGVARVVKRRSVMEVGGWQHGV